MNRRRMLGLTAGSIVGATALGAFSGSALAWNGLQIEFKGCTEVWVITTQGDLKDGTVDLSVSRPPVVHVVVGHDDGTLECRELLATHENATTVPGQYGDLAVLKLAVDDGEKVLGVITYNRLSVGQNWSEAFDRPSCWAVNEHACATNSDAPSFFDADCVEEALEDVNKAAYECDASIVTGSWERGGGKEDDPEGTSRGRGRGNGRGR
ncbi:hypothetical protein [Halorubellus litoreus]|uniref:SipW-cognate class signal peptide n=1 Tax=Halorubellus litoreus TaxID=755308 RepID=A0ABD5VG80_9EURY